jgi:hypothetical protein
MRRFVPATLAVAGALAAFVTLRDAGAQRVDPRKPSVFVVGTPGGASPTSRGDGRRSGTAALLPSGRLRIAWRKAIGVGVDQAALAGPDGTLAVVTATRGDVIFLDGGGEEKGRVSAGTGAVGPATATSDGTVVFTTSAGDAVGVRRASPRPRFVVRIGGERNMRAAPLSLDDGGVVVATSSDLVALDAEGNVRSRVSLPEPPSAPLLAAGDKVIAIAPTGAVYGWAPGREAVRLGSFGGAVDGGAALAGPSTLVAVIEGNHLVDLDLARAARSSRSIAAQGLYLGPPSVRPVAGGGSLATLLAYTQTRAFAVTVDAGGQEIARAAIATIMPTVLIDGGTAPLVAPAHTGPLVDARGAVAFAAPDGHIGVVGPDGVVDTLGELICAKPTARSSGVAGLTALGRGAFVVTCESGAVAKVTGAEAESLRRPAVTPARPGAAPPAPREEREGGRDQPDEPDERDEPEP